MNPLAAIHVAKKQLGLDDEDYRAVLERVSGKRSAKELTPGQRGLVLDEFRKMGFAPAPPRSRMPAAAPAKGALALDGPFAPKLRALWISGWNLGVVRDRTDKALLSFIERQTGLSHTRFLRDAGDAAKAIEALKAWIAREARVRWPGTAPLPNQTKRAVIAAQLRILGKPESSADGIADLDGYIAALGFQVRASKRKCK